MRRPFWTRRGPRSLLVALLLGTAVVVAFSLYLVRDPTARFRERRSTLSAVSEDSWERTERYVTHRARITASSGLAVEVMVRQPPDSVLDEGSSRDSTLGAEQRSSEGRRPLVLLLGGHRTGREAVELVGDPRGTIVAAISYPYSGNHRVKGLAVLGEAPAIRRGVLDTPPAVMLALDYLLTLSGVDSSRVELVGVSLGAQFVPVVGALDPRVTRVWSMHGGGDPWLLLQHGLRRSISFPPARWLVAGIANVAIGAPQLAPERWVGRIAPRPFIMVNASEDERIPRRSVNTLYEHAREPRELIWISGRHIMPNRADIIAQLVNIVFNRVSPLSTAPVADEPAERGS